MSTPSNLSEVLSDVCLEIGANLADIADITVPLNGQTNPAFWRCYIIFTTGKNVVLDIATSPPETLHLH